MEEIDEVFIYLNFPEHKIQIGAQLNETQRDQIISFLSATLVRFARSHEDMIGIDPEVVIHHLQVNPYH